MPYKILKFTVTPLEAEQITVAARIKDMSVASFLRSLALEAASVLNKRTPGRPHESNEMREFRRLDKLVGGIYDKLQQEDVDGFIKRFGPQLIEYSDIVKHKNLESLRDFIRRAPWIGG